MSYRGLPFGTSWHHRTFSSVRGGENNGRGYPRVLCKSAILTLLPARFPLSLADFAQQFSAIVPPARLLLALPLLVPLACFPFVLLATFAFFFSSSPILSVDDLLTFFCFFIISTYVGTSLVFLLSYFHNRLSSMLVTWLLKY